MHTNSQAWWHYGLLWPPVVPWRTPRSRSGTHRAVLWRQRRLWHPGWPYSAAAASRTRRRPTMKSLDLARMPNAAAYFQAAEISQG